MSDSIPILQARRHQALRNLLSFYPDGAPLPGSERARAAARIAVGEAWRDLVAAKIRDWREKYERIPPLPSGPLPPGFSVDCICIHCATRERIAGGTMEAFRQAVAAYWRAHAECRERRRT